MLASKIDFGTLTKYKSKVLGLILMLMLLFVFSCGKEKQPEKEVEVIEENIIELDDELLLRGLWIIYKKNK